MGGFAQRREKEVHTFLNQTSLGPGGRDFQFGKLAYETEKKNTPFSSYTLSSPCAVQTLTYRPIMPSLYVHTLHVQRYTPARDQRARIQSTNGGRQAGEPPCMLRQRLYNENYRCTFQFQCVSL